MLITVFSFFPDHDTPETKMRTVILTKPIGFKGFQCHLLLSNDLPWWQKADVMYFCSVDHYLFRTIDAVNEKRLLKK